tara:strand:- start:153 stop:278 length:126 start_codon:yes stop_codon:yes gene_type:complete
VNKVLSGKEARAATTAPTRARAVEAAPTNAVRNQFKSGEVK